jgi:hypothetical protein
LNQPTAVGDRHAVGVEEARVVHHHHEPLRVERAVRAAELGHVGMDGELLPGDEDVRVDDRRLDHGPPVDRARRLDEALVAQERARCRRSRCGRRTRTTRGSSSSRAERRGIGAPAEAPPVFMKFMTASWRWKRPWPISASDASCEYMP